ncbi:hypothetical protein [Persicobacter sp. CCB-QB2]|uniref:hypothetical protein n=1 Tax=Persicobacter sp. CCB-QB2 TaxID=1561025 RepID=UPI0012FC9D0E|nr:hypothetical protein [Persicobacter sp. CCB-QB2]
MSFTIVDTPARSPAVRRLTFSPSTCTIYSIAFRVVSDFVLFGKLIQTTLPHDVRVPQARDLHTASFRLYLTVNTLAFCYVVGTTNPHYGLAPIS